MFNRLKEITIMKKYIAPSVEILALNTESGLMLTISAEISTKTQLSNRFCDVDENWDDLDWDDED